MSQLILGPLLRHVGHHDATIWVETDSPCTVEVLGHRERTWEVGGHHYALVCVGELEPASTTTYDVRLDGVRVWPQPDDRFPPPRIRVLDPDRELRIAFGSCRYATPDAVVGNRRFDADALDAFAVRLMRTSDAHWPDALALLGDQIYADETSDRTKERIRRKRDITRPPKDQVADFEEYTWLYYESWSDLDIRWLLSTIPSSMIFDDHDVRDDWNTSKLWREEMQRTSWWEERIIGGLSSYWVYQHLGNLSPQALADDPLYQKVREYDGDVTPLLRDFAAAADREADGQKGAQWSYRRDLSCARLLVVDSRCGRMLESGERSIVSDAEFAWIEQQVEGDYDHLVVGTSLPWLLPRALHDVEAWNEVLADGARGRVMARIAEKFRRAADLEHWAAFRKSFDRLAELFACIGRGEHAGSAGEPPATICVLSGDVHHAYASLARYPDRSDDRPIRSKIYQLTCSPVHNFVPPVMKVAFRISWSSVAEKVTRFILDRISHVPQQPLSWDRLAGPCYGNAIATLRLHGRTASLVVEQAGRDRAGNPTLTPVIDLELTD